MQRVMFLLAGLVLLFGKPALAEPVQTGFLDKAVTVQGAEHRYVVYVPRDYSKDKKWPVILFLHGAGERGTDGEKQSQVGIGSAIRMAPERFPAVVVMPQCAPNQNWGKDEMIEFAVKALDQTVTDYNGDTDRLYLTGLSLGGFGTWAIGAKYPDKFAALAPVCGGGDPKSMPDKLKAKPIWIFHGEADPTVPVARSREMVEAFKAAGSTSVKYTEYPGVGHNSWDKAYAEKELTDWMFAQKKGAK